MPWYAAHAILYFEITDAAQENYQVHENIFLIQADSPQEGYAKARIIGSRDEGDSRGTLRVGERPARMVFAGIRKLVSVLHERADDQIGDGDEITYSEMVVADLAAVHKLVSDEDVDLDYIGKQSSE